MLPRAAALQPRGPRGAPPFTRRWRLLRTPPRCVCGCQQATGALSLGAGMGAGAGGPPTAAAAGAAAGAKGGGRQPGRNAALVAVAEAMASLRNERLPYVISLTLTLRQENHSKIGRKREVKCGVPTATRGDPGRRALPFPPATHAAQSPQCRRHDQPRPAQPHGHESPTPQLSTDHRQPGHHHRRSWQGALPVSPSLSRRLVHSHTLPSPLLPPPCSPAHPCSFVWL